MQHLQPHTFSRESLAANPVPQPSCTRPNKAMMAAWYLLSEADAFTRPPSTIRVTRPVSPVKIPHEERAWSVVSRDTVVAVTSWPIAPLNQALLTCPTRPIVVEHRGTLSQWRLSFAVRRCCLASPVSVLSLLSAPANSFAPLRGTGGQTTRLFIYLTSWTDRRFHYLNKPRSNVTVPVLPVGLVPRSELLVGLASLDRWRRAVLHDEFSSSDDSIPV